MTGLWICLWLWETSWRTVNNNVNNDFINQSGSVYHQKLSSHHRINNMWCFAQFSTFSNLKKRKNTHGGVLVNLQFNKWYQIEQSVSYLHHFAHIFQSTGKCFQNFPRYIKICICVSKWNNSNGFPFHEKYFSLWYNHFHQVIVINFAFCKHNFVGNKEKERLS